MPSRDCVACGYLEITAICKARPNSLLLNVPQMTSLSFDLENHTNFQHTIREVKITNHNFKAFDVTTLCVLLDAKKISLTAVSLRGRNVFEFEIIY